MSRAAIAGLTLFAATAWAWTTPAAHARDCVEVAQTQLVNGDVRTIVTQVCDATVDEGGSDPTTSTGQTPATSIEASTLGIGLCISRAELSGVDPEEVCYGEVESDVAAPSVTPALVLQAFRDTDLPSSLLQVQPPNGRTLVNFETNFFTIREPFTRVVTLLGQRVELRITPTQFTWRFGDGTETTTATPGAPYPDLQVTHDYTRTGDYAPSVDTTYGAEWRLGGGAWQPVPGTVTITGEPVALEAVEAQPTLVGAYG